MVSCAVCGYAYTGTAGYSQLKHGEKCYSYYRHTYDTMYPVSCKGSFPSDAIDAAVWNWLCEKFEDEEALAHAIDEEQEEREKLLLPRRQELESVSTLIAKNERGLLRVRKLYYDENITEEEYYKDAQPYVDVIASLERQRARLEALIATQVFSNEAKRTILEMARNVRKGIAAAQNDFSQQRHIVEMLQMQCQLEVKDGKKLIHISCVAGEGVVSCDQTVQKN